MKNILVPTDFSAEAQTALMVAVDMAKRFDGNVVLLNVVDAPSGSGISAMGGGSGSNLDDVYTIKLIERMRSELAEMVAPFGPDAPIRTEMALGDLHDMVNERIALDMIDLVIMGTKGADGFQEVMVGSNAEKVVRRATCPVLAVKNSGLDIAPDHIAFASDFTENYDIIAPKLMAFQQVFGATLHLLFVNTPNKFEPSSESNKRMKSFADRYHLTNYTMNVYNHRDEEDGILGFAEERDMDIIAVATHSRQGLAHLLSGSIAEGVVNHSLKPVLTFSLKYIK
ncbi:MAG: universal stress protein [Bacteroidetes bacterium]|nr:universal stress protein [Bacteroidota bacterium]